MPDRTYLIRAVHVRGDNLAHAETKREALYMDTGKTPEGHPAASNG